MIKPRTKPKRIHNLLRGANKSDLRNVRIKKIVASNKKAIPILRAPTK